MSDSTYCIDNQHLFGTGSLVPGGVFLLTYRLAKQFDSMYYVEVETGSFIEFFHSEMLSGLNLPEQGSDFFSFLPPV